MKRIEFAVTYPPALRHPLHRRILDHAAATRAELLTWGPTASVTALLWVDADEATTDALLSASASTVARSLVDAREGTYAFVRQREFEFADAVMSLVADAGVAFLPPVSFREDGAVGVEAVGDPADLHEFHAEVNEVADTRIERVHEFERGRSPAALTGRQRAALETAADVGYYDVPRTAGVADVADRLDCAPSTAGELLRKAEATVVDDYTRS
ncbi:helix-turn-helix domain-containing protein [Halobaculum lipolyticum]|uniref:Helix-turn-helix domain-containing protein n=1 Tax=Halobaculum lipolyticum TaxID=3032001 RepID=A0ABD5WDN5_9EURY|nr:helix-turn-helix domain-containing protein [Halobaculum sp. DT31]